MADKAESPQPAAKPATAPQSAPEFIAEYEASVGVLTPAERKEYFHKNKTPEAVRALNILCNQADAKRGAERKAFFLAHPELEIRYSAGNFIPQK
jgi:hypothetical protein